MIHNYALNHIASTNPVSRQGMDSKMGAVEWGEAFSGFLEQSIQDLQAQQQRVDELNVKFAAGEAVDIHSMMIAAEKARLGLQLTVQIRNKAVEAYHEIMRMQI